MAPEPAGSKHTTEGAAAAAMSSPAVPMSSPAAGGSPASCCFERSIGGSLRGETNAAEGAAGISSVIGADSDTSKGAGAGADISSRTSGATGAAAITPVAYLASTLRSDATFAQLQGMCAVHGLVMEEVQQGGEGAGSFHCVRLPQHCGGAVVVHRITCNTSAGCIAARVHCSCLASMCGRPWLADGAATGWRLAGARD